MQYSHPALESYSTSISKDRKDHSGQRRCNQTVVICLSAWGQGTPAAFADAVWLLVCQLSPVRLSSKLLGLSQINSRRLVIEIRRTQARRHKSPELQPLSCCHTSLARKERKLYQGLPSLTNRGKEIGKSSCSFWDHNSLQKIKMTMWFLGQRTCSWYYFFICTYRDTHIH